MLTAYYNELGYCIEKDGGGDIYAAGNCPWESTIVLDPRNFFTLPLETIQEYADRTLAEMSEELGEKFLPAEYEERGNLS